MALLALTACLVVASTAVVFLAPRTRIGRLSVGTRCGILAINAATLGWIMHADYQAMRSVFPEYSLLQLVRFVGAISWFAYAVSGIAFTAELFRMRSASWVNLSGYLTLASYGAVYPVLIGCELIASSSNDPHRGWTKAALIVPIVLPNIARNTLTAVVLFWLYSPCSRR